MIPFLVVAFLIIAVVCLFAAVVLNDPPPLDRGRIGWAGLFFWSLAVLLEHIPK